MSQKKPKAHFSLYIYYNPKEYGEHKECCKKNSQVLRNPTHNEKKTFLAHALDKKKHIRE